MTITGRVITEQPQHTDVRISHLRALYKDDLINLVWWLVTEADMTAQQHDRLSLCISPNLILSGVEDIIQSNQYDRL